MSSGERMKAILKLGIRQGCPLPPFLFNKVLEFLARALSWKKKRKEKKLKEKQNKEISKLEFSN